MRNASDGSIWMVKRRPPIRTPGRRRADHRYLATGKGGFRNVRHILALHGYPPPSELRKISIASRRIKSSSNPSPGPQDSDQFHGHKTLTLEIRAEMLTTSSNHDILRSDLTVQLWCKFSMLKRAYLGNSVPICAYRPLKNPCKYKGNMAPALGIEPRT